MQKVVGLADGPFLEMVNRSLLNINRTFFLIYDNTENAMRPWLVWAASKPDAIETVQAWMKWTGSR